MENIKNVCFSALVRHGERTDHKGQPTPNKIDPSLTEYGFEQGAITGKFLKKYFDGEGLTFDEIIIETSPFIRCMQTAKQIALELNVKTIQINF